MRHIHSRNDYRKRTGRGAVRISIGVRLWRILNNVSLPAKRAMRSTDGDRS